MTRTTDDPILARLAQRSLAADGYYKGAIDGLWGPLSDDAFRAFATAGSGSPHGDPAWLVLARREIGQAEISGPGTNPRIVYYDSFTDLAATDDETPWCSAFVNAMLQLAGIRGTRSAAARSFLAWGRPLAQPTLGAIAVFARGTDGFSGHVAFYIGDAGGGRVRILGGNQGDQVCIESTGTDRLLGYRWPNEFQLPV